MSTGANDPGGTRTHNKPILSRLPLPVGPLGRQGAMGAPSSTKARPIAPSASGGTRTHNAPVLSRRPLPLGYRGKQEGKVGLEPTGHESSRFAIAPRCQLRDYLPLFVCANVLVDACPGWESNPQRTDSEPASSTIGIPGPGRTPSTKNRRAMPRVGFEPTTH